MTGIPLWAQAESEAVRRMWVEAWSLLEDARISLREKQDGTEWSWEAHALADRIDRFLNQATATDEPTPLAALDAEPHAVQRRDPMSSVRSPDASLHPRRRPRHDERNQVMKLWNKFLVVRRDNTVPDWPYLVIGGRDPSGPVALRAYAADARERGMDPELCDDIEGLADDFDEYRAEHGDGDPDAPPHRADDPAVVSRFKRGTDRSAR